MSFGIGSDDDHTRLSVWFDGLEPRRPHFLSIRGQFVLSIDTDRGGQVSLVFSESELGRFPLSELVGSGNSSPLSFEISDSSGSTVLGGVLHFVKSTDSLVFARGFEGGNDGWDIAGPHGPVGEWSLVFNEEFEGQELDTAFWTPEMTWVPVVTNEELHYYDPDVGDNVKIGDGFLELIAEPRAQNDQPYSSGHISSHKSSPTFLVPLRFGPESRRD